MKHSVLVTGGAGFLGRHVSERLAKTGWQVTALDNLGCSNSTFDCPQLAHPQIKQVLGSILDRELMRRLMAEHECIVHFASVVGVEETISHPLDTARNLTGTLYLAEFAAPDQILLFGSSADVYGMHSHIHDGPMREADNVVYGDALVTRWLYPKIKAVEESVIANSAARSVSARIFNCFGPGMDYPNGKRVIPQFANRLMNAEPLLINGSGAQRRSFCYYEDTVEGLIRCLSYASTLPAGGHDTVNIGSDESSLSILELARLMIRVAMETELVDRDPGIVHLDSGFYTENFDDTWNRVPDLTKARTLLGFEARASIEQGMQTFLSHCHMLKKSELLVKAGH